MFNNLRGVYWLGPRSPGQLKSDLVATAVFLASAAAALAAAAAAAAEATAVVLLDALPSRNPHPKACSASCHSWRPYPQPDDSLINNTCRFIVNIAAWLWLALHSAHLGHMHGLTQSSQDDGAVPGSGVVTEVFQPGHVHTRCSAGSHRTKSTTDSSMVSQGASYSGDDSSSSCSTVAPEEGAGRGVWVLPVMDSIQDPTIEPQMAAAGSPGAAPVQPPTKAYRSTGARLAEDCSRSDTMGCRATNPVNLEQSCKRGQQCSSSSRGPPAICRAVSGPPEAPHELLEEWEPLNHLLGCGGSGFVRLMVHRVTGLYAACKTCRKRTGGPQWGEVEAMRLLTGHPKVVQLLSVYEDADCVHMVMEWCSSGTLGDHLAACGGRLPEEEVARIMAVVLQVLEDCHDRGIMHRDIKPDNFLVAHGGTGSVADRLKVSDFGISLLSQPYQVFSEVAGTLEYMAPEVLSQAYGHEADTWSAGIMMCQLLTGQLPYPGLTRAQVLRGIRTKPLDILKHSGISEDAYCLLSLLLTPEAALRPAPRDLLHRFKPWLEQ